MLAEELIVYRAPGKQVEIQIFFWKFYNASDFELFFYKASPFELENIKHVELWF